MSSETVPRAVPATGQVAPYRWYVYAACTVLAIALNFVFGKETAWDLLHYHLYAGFSALNDRFDLDYFAAGVQSYFNPYAYVPFYALVKLGLPALAVGTVLAMIHSVVLWLTYELACRVSPSEDRKGRFFFGVCATVLAFMNPVLLQQIGSSFSDITTTGLVLGGWLLLVQAVLRPRMKLVIFAATLLGFATALKPTNGLYAVTAFLLVAFFAFTVCRTNSPSVLFRCDARNQFCAHRRAVVLSAGTQVWQPGVSDIERCIPLTGIHHRDGARCPFHSGYAGRGPLPPVRNDRYRFHDCRGTPGPGHSLRLAAGGFLDIRYCLDVALEQACCDSSRNRGVRIGHARSHGAWNCIYSRLDNLVEQFGK